MAGMNTPSPGKPSRVNKYIPKRSVIVIAVCMLAWCAILIRLFYLQVISYEKYQNNVIDNIERETTVTPTRGIIYDSNMIQLATNKTTWRIFISPRDIEDDAQGKLIADNLSEILGADYNDILAKEAKKERADETIAKDITEEEFDKVVDFIEEHELYDQVHYQAYTKRDYPYGSLASHVIGFCGTDGGLIGLEYQYDEVLTGVAGKYITARDARGKKMPYKYDTYIEAENGVNLVSTINMKIQSVLETQLKNTYYDSNAIHRVTGIVMNPNTGAVYGMGTYPDFNLNSPYELDDYSKKELEEYAEENKLKEDSEEYQTKYWEEINAMWKNKAVSELYEPGSTFKVITAASAIEENAVTFEDTFFCPGKNYYVEGYEKPIGCHKQSGHGTVTFRVGLQQSCNPTLMQVAARLGKQLFYRYFNAFGYSEKCGIDLPGEASQLYTDYSSFNQVELATYSFGQTFKVTPIQHLTSICAVANGGYLVTPYVVDKIVDDSGNVIKTTETNVRRQVVSPEVCRQVSEVLEEGVSGDGGAKNTYVAGYKIAAKTGTSQVRDVLDDYGNSYLVVGSTVAYAPSDDPVVAVLIVVDAPQCSSYYGSYVAAPYVANVLQEILPILGVERVYSDAESSLITIGVTDYKGWQVEDAKTSLEEKSLEYEVVGEGNVVNDQTPSAGAIVSVSTGKVILYTGKEKPEENMITVPDCVGETASSANSYLTSKGFNVKVDGATNKANLVVTAQEPEAGTELPKGSVITITVRYTGGTE